MSNNVLNVNALYVSNKKIYYECPFCWTSKINKKQYCSNYNNTGRKIKSRIPTIHHHGNEKQQTGIKFNTQRSSHCLFNDSQVCIQIHEDTPLVKM